MTPDRATLPNPDWRVLASPIARAEDALARLDERLAKSPIRDGWIARTHFSDAADALWIVGELVHIEDLVLHDAGMDVRTPTHEQTRAHAILRVRRRIADAAPDWALSPAGLDVLRGRAGQGTPPPRADAKEGEPEANEEEDFEPWIEAEAEFAELFAAVDSASLRVDRALKGEGSPKLSPARERDTRLAQWRICHELCRRGRPRGRVCQQSSWQSEA